MTLRTCEFFLRCLPSRYRNRPSLTVKVSDRELACFRRAMLPDMEQVEMQLLGSSWKLVCTLVRRQRGRLLGGGWTARRGKFQKGALELSLKRQASGTAQQSVPQVCEIGLRKPEKKEQLARDSEDCSSEVAVMSPGSPETGTTASWQGLTKLGSFLTA
jgi:hypothetical protein